MRRATSLSAIAATAISLMLSPNALNATQDDDAVLRTLNAGYVKAFLTGDVAWYDAHIAPDFQCIESTGELLDRAAFLESNRKGPGATISYDLSDVTVRRYGNTALVHAVGEWRTSNGTSGRSRYIDTYVKIGTSWKVVQAQITAIRE